MVAEKIGGVDARLFKVYEVGTPAFYDTFAGMVPCKILAILDDDCNGRVCHSGKVRFEVTESLGAYKKGEILEAHASDVPPRKQRKLSGCHYRVNTLYIYKNK